MEQDTVINIMQQSLYAIMIVSAPPLLIGLVVGIIVSIFQTVTSIQEPTLAFIPKILAVLIAIIVFGPFMLTTLEEFITALFLGIPQFITPR